MHLMFCPGCGKHWEVQIQLAGWVQRHAGCGTYLMFCQDLEHDLFTKDVHDVDNGRKYLKLQELQVGSWRSAHVRRQRSNHSEPQSQPR